MSREFPFINDDAEGLRDGNKDFEAHFATEMLNKDYIKMLSPESFLALDGGVTRYSLDTPHAEMWDISSIFSFGDSGLSWVK